MASFCGVFLASTCASLCFSPHAYAVSNFPPSAYVLGQNDGLVSTPQPIYIKGTINNAAHKLGLSAPVIGITMDTTDHRLFVSDTTNHRVLVYGLDASNVLIDRIPDNVLGQYFFWSNTAANTQAGMNTPNGIAFDDTNNRLFVAQGTSTTSARVTVYDVSSITDGEDAMNVLGQASFTVSTAATTQEGLNLPTGVVFDGTNNRLFVVNNGANRVTVYDTTTIADGEAAINVLGQANFTTATAATTQAGMNVPYDVALSGSTTLFVSQGTGNRVTAYDVTSITDGENAVKVLGQANYTATAVGTTQTTLSGPRGINYAPSQKKLYVADFTNNRVLLYNLGTTFAEFSEPADNILGQTLFTTATAAITQAGLSGPAGVYMDAVNNILYALQFTSHRISLFDLAAITNGEAAANVVGQTDDNITTPGPIYTKGVANNGPYKLGLNAPSGLAVDTTNHRLFVSDTTNNRVLVYNLTSDNTPIDVIPDNVLGQAVFYTNAVGSTQSTLSAPTGLAFNATANKLFVSDFTNNRILVFDTASIVDGENAVNVLGQVTFTAVAAAITQLGLTGPRQIAYDSISNNLFVADATNNRVVIYDVATVIDGEGAINVLGQNDGTVSTPQPIYIKGAANNGPHKLGLNAPVLGMVMDTVDHRLFVSDTSNNRVLVYNLDSNNDLIDRTPDNVIGQLNFYTSAAASTRGGLNIPNGIEYDSATKRLFVAQTTGNRVTIFDTTTIVDGEDAVNVLGQTSYTVVTAATTQVGLNVPTGVTYGGSGSRLYVAQNTGNRVSVFDLRPMFADYMNADNLLGQNDADLSAPAPIYTKTTAHNGPNKLGYSAPIIGIVMDTVDHRLFVSDTSNNRVLVYNLDGSNALLDRIPDNVLGQVNFYSNAAANTQIGLNTPNGVTYDSTGKRLFVAEPTGNRVKVFDVAAITDGENAANVLGQVTFIASTAATTQAGMNTPNGVALGGSGSRLYVAQTGNNRVTAYNIADGITDGENAVAVLGQATYTAATAATTQAGMNVPYDVALSGSTVTTLFVSQGTGNRVTLYDVTSITDGENAVKVLGQANFTGTTAATTQVGMNAPRGITYDSANKVLFVSQVTGNRVTTYNLADGVTDGENAAKVLGQLNFTASTAAVTQAGLSSPTGVYIDSTNQKLYVPQSGASRVSIFDVASITDGENAVDALGQYDDSAVSPSPIYTKGTAHNGPSKSGLSAGVIGLALDPTDHRLFVSDTGNNRVLVYNLDSNDLLIDMIPDNVLGQANYYSNAAASTQSGFETPNGIAFDDTNNRLFVAEGAGSRVKVFDVAAITDGENAVNVLGQSNFTGTTAAITQAGMSQPVDVVYDQTNSRLFVSDATSNRVTVYDVAAITDGENATGVLGQATYVASAAATTQAGMNVPYGLALSGSTATTLFVAQSTGNRVTSFEVSTVTDGENAVKVLGQTLFTATTAATTQAGMNAPRGIAYDATNKRLYVAQITGVRVTTYDVAAITDGENAINVIGQPLFTTASALVAQEGLSAPTGVLADPAHNRVYVLDSTSNRVTSYNTIAGIGNGEPAVAVLGQANYTATAVATTQAGMSLPFDVALSGSALTYLFVSEGTNNRVMLFDVTTIVDGENAIKVLGQTTFITATAAVSQIGMSGPRGIAYDSTNKALYVSQTTANRVTRYNLADGLTDGEGAVKVLGQPNFITSTAGTRQSGLNAPTGSYIDKGNQKLYVPQSGASRVSVFDVTSITDGEDAVNLLGQSDNDLNPPGVNYFKGTANNAAYKHGLSSPQGIAVDGVNHRLFVSDSSNNRVLVYNLDSSNVPIDRTPDNVLGQVNYYQNAVSTTQFGMSAPNGLTFDAVHNHLYVADATNNRILIFDTTSITDGEYAMNVLGQPSFIVATAGTTQLNLSGPRQIEYDASSGKLFVTDSVNNRVNIYQANTVETTSGGDTFHFFGF